MGSTIAAVDYYSAHDGVCSPIGRVVTHWNIATPYNAIIELDEPTNTVLLFMVLPTQMAHLRSSVGEAFGGFGTAVAHPNAYSYLRNT